MKAYVWHAEINHSTSFYNKKTQPELLVVVQFFTKNTYMLENIKLKLKMK